MNEHGRKRRLRIMAAGGCVIVAAVTGCGGGVVDQRRVEPAVSAEINRVLNIDVESVQCPADASAESGERFDCAVRTGTGEELDASLKVLNENADVQIIGVEGR